MALHSSRQPAGVGQDVLPVERAAGADRYMVLAFAQAQADISSGVAPPDATPPPPDFLMSVSHLIVAYLTHTPPLPGAMPCELFMRLAHARQSSTRGNHISSLCCLASSSSRRLCIPQSS